MAEARDKASVESGTATAFVASDFDAYEERKWSSNKFTLERRRVKDKLVSLMKRLQERIGEELAGLEMLASDEAPAMSNARKVDSQLVFFLRPPQERQAIRTLVHTTNLQGGSEATDIALHHEHASLLLRFDQSGLTVGFELAARAKVDRDNAVEKLKQSWARERLLELVQALPAGTQVGFDEALREAAGVTAAEVEEWAAQLPKKPSALRAQHFIARGSLETADADLDALVTHDVRAFLPLYRFLAWSRDNEHKQVKEAIKKVSGDRQKKEAQFQAGDRVTILSGLFAGRGGYLAEIDAKGRAKVMVGPVSVTVEVKDLKAS